MVHINCSSCRKNGGVNCCQKCNDLSNRISLWAILFTIVIFSGTVYWAKKVEEQKHPERAINEALAEEREEKEKYESAFIARAEYAVSQRLKDPESAQFKSGRYHHNPNYAEVSCGSVNAKNSFGGYSGFQRYVSSGSPDSTFLESDMKPKLFNEVWNTMCYGMEKKKDEK